MLATYRLFHLLMHMEPVNYNTDFAFRQQFDSFRSHSKQTVTTSDLSFHRKMWSRIFYYIEDGESRSVGNFGTYLPNYTVSHSRRVVFIPRRENLNFHTNWRVFGNRIPRKIFRPKRQDVTEWTNFKFEKIKKLYSSPKTIVRIHEGWNRLKFSTNRRYKN